MRVARIVVAVAVVVGIIWLWSRRVSAQQLDDVESDDTMRPSKSLDQFAKAIGVAEGFGTPGAIPTRAHNPGDLARGDKGLGTLGSEKITVYANDAAGWQALYTQLDYIARGQSEYYNPGMTIAQMGERWAPGPQGIAWANNVARALGVSSDAVISDWIGDYRP